LKTKSTTGATPRALPAKGTAIAGTGTTVTTGTLNGKIIKKRLLCRRPPY
jgi:hypothetical protein